MNIEEPQRFGELCTKKWIYDLNFLFGRSPLNFKRIPPSLQRKITLKQAAQTFLNFRQTDLESCQLAFETMSRQSLTISILKKRAKQEGLYNERECEIMNMNRTNYHAALISRLTNRKEKLTLPQVCTNPIEERRQEETFFGPKTIPIRQLNGKLFDKVLLKMNRNAFVRMARTSRFVFGRWKRVIEKSRILLLTMKIAKSHFFLFEGLEVETNISFYKLCCQLVASVDRDSLLPAEEPLKSIIDEVSMEFHFKERDIEFAEFELNTKMVNLLGSYPLQYLKIEKRIQPREIEEEKMWLDFQEPTNFGDFCTQLWFFDLKFLLNRRPLNFNRIPLHLRQQIFKQQGLETLMNMSRINSNCCEEVDRTIAQMKVVSLYKEYLSKNTDGITALKREVEKGCSLQHYIDHFFKILITFFIKQGPCKIKEDMKEKISKRVALIKESRVDKWIASVGPKTMELKSLQKKLSRMVIYKMDRKSAARLARSSSVGFQLVKNTFENYFICHLALIVVDHDLRRRDIIYTSDHSRPFYEQCRIMLDYVRTPTVDGLGRFESIISDLNRRFYYYSDFTRTYNGARYWWSLFYKHLGYGWTRKIDEFLSAFDHNSLSTFKRIWPS